MKEWMEVEVEGGLGGYSVYATTEVVVLLVDE